MRLNTNDMEASLIKQIMDAGLGTGILGLLVLIVIGGWKFLDKLMNNHLEHLQTSIDKMGEKMEAGFNKIVEAINK